MSEETPSPRQVLDFWFSDRVRPYWFRSTVTFDEEVRERFEPTWALAREGRLDDWAGSPEGALALVIVLDQFPLNMFRGQRTAYATESKARQVADRALDNGWDALLPDERKSFLFLPFMHSEDLADQERSVILYEAAGLTEGLKWARHHRELIRRFGRFPHRNATLGRAATPEEALYLQSSESYQG